jgi:pseudoazurin
VGSVWRHPKRRVVAAFALRFSAAVAGPCLLTAQAEVHEINTRAAQWVPLVLFIAPGDTVVFRGMRGHETELVEGLAPPGAARWRSALDEDGFSVTLQAPGAYIYKCHTHMSAGMFGAIVVGEGHPDNLGALEAATRALEAGRPSVERVLGRLRSELERRASR